MPNHFQKIRNSSYFHMYMKEKLPRIGQVKYAFGALGYSVMYNIISVMLIYFYLPPSNARMIELVPNVSFFGVITGLSLVLAFGRLTDAITDPLVAFFSDQSKNKKGRRIPYMRLAVIPTLLFGILIFLPIRNETSDHNLVWLAVMLFLFYLSLTIFIVPFNALLPELARTRKEKIYYAAYVSVGFVGGIVLSSQTPLLADIFELTFQLPTRSLAMQFSIGTIAVLAAICMAVPSWSINEKKYCVATPISIPLGMALKQTLSNRNFILFIFTETLYFVALSIIASGMLYFLSVLLNLSEALGGAVMGLMVIVSLIFYPVIIAYSKANGYKLLVISGLLTLGVCMGGVYLMGKLPFSPHVQIFSFSLLASYPLAVLGVLPHAIIAEIAHLDSQNTGEQKEGLYYAVRNFATKLGQTLGLFIFALLTILGKDPENDLGIRLSGIIGMGLCFLAAFLFSRYKDQSFVLSLREEYQI